MGISDEDFAALPFEDQAFISSVEMGLYYIASDNDARAFLRHLALIDAFPRNPSSTKET